jgi:tetratricopeptide (TPR) repeat protein
MNLSAKTPWARRACGGGRRAVVLLAALLIPAAHISAADGPVQDASRLFDAGNYPQAAATLRAALEQKAQGAGAAAAPDASLYYWLARCSFELRDFDRAISSAERAVELEPKNSLYHLWLGRAYGRKAEQVGRLSGFSMAKKTRQQFEEAVRLNPSNLAAQEDLIEFYLRAPGIVGGGEDKAQKQVEALAAVDAVEGHAARGRLWVHRKRVDDAEQEYRQVLAAKAQRPDPYFEAADFYLKRNDPLRMEEGVEAAARLEPSDRRLSFYRGVTRVLAGNRPEEAEKLLKSYLAGVPPRSDLPSHADAHEWLGRLYERQGQCAAAAKEYRQAVELDPHSKSAYDGLRRVQKCPSGQ